MVKHIGLLFIAIALLFSCTSHPKKTLKVAATPIPHAEMLNFIKPDLAKQGIDLEIIEVDDYNIPNRALAYHEINANFFQHIPFMEEQIKQFHYAIMDFAKIHIEPMGIYSKKIHSINELPENGMIAIPNDPTNEARALISLDKLGLIKIDNHNDLNATVLNITSNPKNLKIHEVDAPMLPRSLGDVDAAAIPTNFALQANLTPSKDALILENKTSPYVNIIAIRMGDENDPQLIALKNAMTSEKMRAFILEKYHGAIIPAF